MDHDRHNNCPGKAVIRIPFCFQILASILNICMGIIQWIQIGLTKIAGNSGGVGVMVTVGVIVGRGVMDAVAVGGTVVCVAVIAGAFVRVVEHPTIPIDRMIKKR
jgi:uncharacterized membrane protein YphA (DoxX/SURF4 family)